MLQLELSGLGPGQRILGEPSDRPLKVDIIGRFPNRARGL